MMASSDQMYKAVLSHFQQLKNSLRVTPGAEEELLGLFKINEWISFTATATAEQLISLALNRIKNDVNNFKVFIDMLKSITGLKELALGIQSRAKGKLIIIIVMMIYNYV